MYKEVHNIILYLFRCQTPEQNKTRKQEEMFGNAGAYMEV